MSKNVTSGQSAPANLPFAQEMRELAERVLEERNRAFEADETRRRKAREAIVTSKKRARSLFRDLISHWRTEIRRRASSGQRTFEETWPSTPKLLSTIALAGAAMDEGIAVEHRASVSGGLYGDAGIPEIEVKIRW